MSARIIQLLFAGAVAHIRAFQQHENYQVIEDMVFVEKDNDGKRSLFDQARNLLFQPSIDDRQADVWNKINKMDDYKTEQSFR